MFSSRLTSYLIDTKTFIYDLQNITHLIDQYLYKLQSRELLRTANDVNI